MERNIVREQVPGKSNTRRQSLAVRIGQAFGDLFPALSEEEERQARAAAGQPWKTELNLVHRDWPVPPEGFITLEETYAAMADMAAIEQRAQEEQEKASLANQPVSQV